MARVVDLTNGGFWTKRYAGDLESYAINAVSLMAETLYGRLHSVCDHWGVFPAFPPLLRSRAYPIKTGLSDDQVSAWLDELAKARLVVRYTVDRDTYGLILGFIDRQKTRNGYRVKQYPWPWEAGQIAGKPDSTGSNQSKEIEGRYRRLLSEYIENKARVDSCEAGQDDGKPMQTVARKSKSRSRNKQEDHPYPIRSDTGLTPLPDTGIGTVESDGFGSDRKTAGSDPKRRSASDSTGDSQSDAIATQDAVSVDAAGVVSPRATPEYIDRRKFVAVYLLSILQAFGFSPELMNKNKGSVESILNRLCDVGKGSPEMGEHLVELAHEKVRDTTIRVPAAAWTADVTKRFLETQTHA